MRKYVTVSIWYTIGSICHDDLDDNVKPVRHDIEGAAMRRVILLILLAVLSAGAAAEWVKVGGNDVVTIYVDPATIRKSGDLAKISVLNDFKVASVTADSKEFLSSKGQNEYDCKEAKGRMLAFTFHSGNMGNGSVIATSNDPDDKWSPIPPKSFRESMWKIACGKR